ncbi:MAG: hypothetical protein NUW37_12195 [Planctomycetes bacterium]|nr:hypothetical protein [Planctomycetota bacterium]
MQRPRGRKIDIVYYDGNTLLISDGDNIKQIFVPILPVNIEIETREDALADAMSLFLIETDAY